jgi:hypothetical protein
VQRVDLDAEGQGGGGRRGPGQPGLGELAGTENSRDHPGARVRRLPEQPPGQQSGDGELHRPVPGPDHR